MHLPLTTIKGCEHCRNEGGFWINGHFVPCERCNPDDNTVVQNAKTARATSRRARPDPPARQRTAHRSDSSPGRHRTSGTRTTRASSAAPTKQKLTKPQHQALAFIRDHMTRTGTAPTHDEIAAELGLTTPAHAESYLNALARKGHIRRLSHTHRGIRVL